MVTTEYGQSLQQLAYRELQDASRWPEIARLNELRPPYLTGNKLHPGVASGQVLLYGTPIKIPSLGTMRQSITARAAYGSDLLLSRGRLTADGAGGLALVQGVPNLKQALETRLSQEIGCLSFHPRYGNLAHRLKGTKSDANIHLLILQFCEETLLSDPRVKGVRDGVAASVGDAVRVTVTALVDSDSPLKLQIEI